MPTGEESPRWAGRMETGQKGRLRNTLRDTHMYTCITGTPEDHTGTTDGGSYTAEDYCVH